MFSYQNNHKDLDLSYKTNLDLCDFVLGENDRFIASLQCILKCYDSMTAHINGNVFYLVLRMNHGS